MALPVDVLEALANLPEPLGGGLEWSVLLLQWQEHTEEYGVSGPSRPAQCVPKEWRKKSSLSQVPAHVSIRDGGKGTRYQNHR